MAIFVKIAETFYKVPNRITVGRGAPFNQFDHDQSIARSHLELKNTSKGVVLKDLGSELGVVVNGKKLQKKKSYLIKANDQIKMGQFPIEILAKAPNEKLIEIQGIQKKKMQLSYKQKFIAAIVGFIMLYTSYDVFFNHSNSSFAAQIGVITLIGAICLTIIPMLYFEMKILYKLMGVKVPKDIFMSEEGFTVHFENGKNMTFNSDSIEYWVEHVVKHKEVKRPFIFDSGEMTKKLIVYLKETFPEKEKKQIPTKWFYLLSGIIAGVLTMGPSTPGHKEYIVAGVILLLGIYTLSWMKKNNYYSQNERNKFLQTAGMIAFCAIYFAYDGYDKSLSYSALISCSQENIEQCKKIDFSNIDKKVVKDFSLIDKARLACDQKNESACFELKYLERVKESDRAIASQKTKSLSDYPKDKADKLAGFKEEARKNSEAFCKDGVESACKHLEKIDKISIVHVFSLPRKATTTEQVSVGVEAAMDILFSDSDEEAMKSTKIATEWAQKFKTKCEAGEKESCYLEKHFLITAKANEIL